MIKLKDIELSSYHKTLLWVLSFTALFTKILLESIFLLFDQFSSPYAIIIRFILSLVVFLSLLLVFYLGFKSGLNEWMASTEYFFKEVLQIIILNILLLILSFFLPGYIVSGGMPRQIFDIIVINIFAFFSLFISVYSYKFLIKWI